MDKFNVPFVYTDFWEAKFEKDISPVKTDAWGIKVVLEVKKSY